MTVRLLPYGPDALLVETAPHNVLATSEAIRRWAAATGACAEVVPAQATVLVMVLGIGTSDALRRELAEVVAGAKPKDFLAGDTHETITIPVRYNGADLDAVARMVGCSVSDLVAQHSSAPYRVAFCGFVPGFAYLSGLAEALHVPRRSTPRHRVPAGSVAIAAGYCGVYPRSSPGGWHVIGSTEAVLWDPSRATPALLVPGTTVRFTEVAP
jgi:KipI family sensor histidine kinase inhibitor